MSQSVYLQTGTQKKNKKNDEGLPTMEIDVIVKASHLPTYIRVSSSQVELD